MGFIDGVTNQHLIDSAPFDVTVDDILKNYMTIPAQKNMWYES